MLVSKVSFNLGPCVTATALLPLEAEVLDAEAPEATVPLDTETPEGFTFFNVPQALFF